MKITIKKYRVQLDPNCWAWNVEIESKDSKWCESFGSEDQLMMFIRGFTAGCHMNKFFNLETIWDKDIGRLEIDT